MNIQLSNALQQYEHRIKGKFKPDRRFYTAVSINQKRFGQLIRGEAELRRSEILALSDFFNLPATYFL